MNNFTKYIETKGYSDQTKATYQRYINSFISWLAEENKEVTKVSYNDVLAYVKNRKALNQTSSYINNQLSIIRLFFDCLEVEENPATGIELKGRKHKLPSNLLNEKQLDELYQNAESREKEIIGFLVYQGMKTGEIDKLLLTDVDLKKGEVFIKGSSKSNSRKLPLKAHQAISLHHYISKIRDLENEFLFTKSRFIYIMSPLNRKLKSKYQVSVLEIRNSVICNWLSHFNLREVQYMAGHKYVSSTERYQKVKVADLQQSVLKYHPLQ
jgi:integrase/recombinase XerD